MSIYNLDKIFHPASLAVIGASPGEGTIGSALVKNTGRRMWRKDCCSIRSIKRFTA